MSRRSFAAVLALAAIVGLTPSAATAILSIRDDATGGDCALIGSWDAVTRMCTLTGDVAGQPDGGIRIDGAEISLDGAGHALTSADGASGQGVWTFYSHVTIRNLTVVGFDRGVFFDYGSSYGTVDGVTIRGAGAGMEFRGGEANVVRNSRIENSYNLILFEGGTGYTVQDSLFAGAQCALVIRGDDGIIERNVFTGVNYPLYVVGSIGGDSAAYVAYPASRNVIRENTFVGGIVDLQIANDNVVVNNDFLAGARGMIVPEYLGFTFSGGVFDEPLPIGGNYWEGAFCEDLNADGICDAPVAFQGGADALPWKVLQGWRDHDGDGSPLAVDCNDQEPSIHPGALETLNDGIDQNCNGMADGVDLDGDGFAAAADCNDNNATIHPGVPEVKHDAIDQDCNGYDLTIDVVRAVNTPALDSLRVDATSALLGSAALVVDGYGAMKWRANQQEWTLALEPAGGSVSYVTVCGIEGCTSGPVVLE